MSRCFVIQPFDKGKFDKRFNDTFSPAIQEAGYEPYRVDQDPSASIPIERITSEIHDADAVLADITTNNPNVWFELGLAIAYDKDVILICSTERDGPYPFDVQHRKIVRYSNDSASDFEDLKGEIIARLKTFPRLQKPILAALNESPVSESSGLAPHEIAILGYLIQNRLLPSDTVFPQDIKSSMLRWGYTGTAVALGLDSLLTAGYITIVEQPNYNGDNYENYQLTSKGLAWAHKNKKLFKLESQRVEDAPTVDEYDPFADE